MSDKPNMSTDSMLVWLSIVDIWHINDAKKESLKNKKPSKRAWGKLSFFSSIIIRINVSKDILKFI